MKEKKTLFAQNASIESDKHKDLYLESIDGIKDKHIILGKNATEALELDPKGLLFVLSRHKFVSKMFKNFKSVLDIGCQEGLGTRIVKQNVDYVLAIDFYKPYIDYCNSTPIPGIDFECFDLLASPIKKNFDGVYALDVLEHIYPEQSEVFMKNMYDSLSAKGVAIIGMPSLESQAYASKRAKLGHVNCMTGDELHEKCRQHFTNVFLFSMNDEVLHTGYLPMSQYIFALCCK